MKKTTVILDLVHRFVRQQFERRIPAKYTYHCLAHTEFVALSARKIALACNLEKLVIEDLELAAYFHDIGYADGSTGHEERGAKEAAQFLEKQDFDKERTTRIQAFILGTRMAVEPKTIGEKIMRDADAAHLGTTHFFTTSNLLRTEWEVVNGKFYTEIDWLKLNLDFISNHRYFTTAAEEFYGEQKRYNIERLKELVNREIR